MIAWWTPEQSSTLLGYAGATVGICWALVGVADVLARKGRAKVFVFAMAGTVTAIGAGVACAAVVALLMSQPSHVVQPMALGGGMVGALGVVINFVARKRFAETEQRRLDAAALRQA